MNLPSRPTHYDILEVAPTASDGVIRAAYKNLSQRHHPDVNPASLKESEGKMKDLNEAYRVLSDKNRRMMYDSSLDFSSHRNISDFDNSRVNPLDSGDWGAREPATGWGITHEGRAIRWFRGWVEYRIFNDTSTHAWLTWFSLKSRAIKSVFVRAGDQVNIILSARPVSLSIVFGMSWQGPKKGFMDERAIWLLRDALNPPGPQMRMDIVLSKFEREGKFEVLPARVSDKKRDYSEVLPVFPPASRPSSAFLLLGTLSLLGLMVLGTFRHGPPSSLLAAGILGALFGIVLSVRLAHSGERILSGTLSALCCAAIWSTAGWYGLSHALSAVGWQWGPSTITALLWGAASLGPPALAWRSWVSSRRPVLHHHWVWLLCFSTAAFAGMWGSVFGWEAVRYHGGAVRTSLDVISLSVISVSLVWTFSAELLAALIRRVARLVFGLRASWMFRQSFKLLLAWGLLPVIAILVTPWLPSRVGEWLVGAWQGVLG